MVDVKLSQKSARNDRYNPTARESEAFKRLDGEIAGRIASIHSAMQPSAAHSEMLKLRARTQAALHKLMPELEKEKASLEKIKQEFAATKGQRTFGWPGGAVDVHGVTWPIGRFEPVSFYTASSRQEVLATPVHLSDVLKPPPVIIPIYFVGELWWATTHASWTGLNVDFETGPYRIWGHIPYNSDSLMNGHAGLVMRYMLTPDRMPTFGGRRHYYVDPSIRILGWVSGWTGLYHWLWAADDKWSKCWRLLRATLSTTDNVKLAENMANTELFNLKNVGPVGQANINQDMLYRPHLAFEADMIDLRARGVTIILELECHYTFQLEGESDIWFDAGAGTTPGYESAVTLACSPGTIAPL